MTAGEQEKIGRLIGTVEAQERRLGKIEVCLSKLDEKLDAMQQHVAPVAAQLAKELAAYRVEEAKWKVEVVGPLRDGVSSYLRFRWLVTISAGGAVFLLSVATAALKLWNVF